MIPLTAEQEARLPTIVRNVREFLRERPDLEELLNDEDL